MWFKHRAWIPVAWLLSLTNLGAVWFAALPGEPWHASIHAALAVLLAVAAQRLVARRASLRAEVAIGENREERLEQAIEAIAIELERVGEGQRFVAKVLAERECEAFRAKGLCVPILRPKTFVGPERLGIWSIASGGPDGVVRSSTYGDGGGSGSGSGSSSTGCFVETIECRCEMPLAAVPGFCV